MIRKENRSSTSDFELKHSIPHYYTTAMRLARIPKTARTFALSVYVLLVLIVLGLIFIPWQQNVIGSGTVTSFVPNARPQSIDAQIDGRIVKWFVNEGAPVAAGDTIAVLRDIDTKFLDTNFVEKNAIIRENTAKEQELSVIAAEQKVIQARQKHLSAIAQRENTKVGTATARIQYNRALALESEGLIPRKDLELSLLKYQKAISDSIKAEAELSIALRTIYAAEAERNAKERKANAIIAKAELEFGNVSQRKNAGVVIAPIDGTVVRISQAGPGQTVKKGSQLAIIAPETDDIAAEIMVGSLDAALISPGRPARMQFAGFPAIQFSGWPDMSLGTFGGTVAVIDAVDDGTGRYRVLIVPDQNDRAWPDRTFLRQGTEVTGWVLLNEVPLGYEFWRIMNGFPPIVPVKTNPKSHKDAKKTTKGEK
ncbi:HlyD family secretion protein [Chloroherpeton thalassium ATCC 35110]|uniref:HlyD family secretion protein n=1 Tax=Chloroherpeton thalassium (strain ATCC 35110 / GB-78) TaxID=517418 RepID=B3QS98_CHLT3|nr:HlyD family efflux transporter periplasmic adaptor subunit [Chloroherpeton thalassium]ACF12489.1 HlyD family secretion protein [Chloroherpeton thalassium ATCC 35110]